MNKLTFSDAFFCIKLRSGETLFAEVIDVDQHAMTVICPMLVLNNEKESIAMTPWIPFIKRSQIPIPMSMVYFADNLNQTFFEYYGRSVIQSEINKIKQRTFEKMVSRDDYVTMSEGLDEMKQISEELTTKFGVEGPDFSDFESVLESYKENLVMH